jgi:hypothetical protein
VTAILIGLLLVVTIAMMAYLRRGTRPLYLAIMLIALMGAAACNALIPSRLEITQTVSEAEQRGGQFLYDYGPPITVVWLAVAFGCLLALILYRRPVPKERGSTTPQQDIPPQPDDFSSWG